jgi:hypothetical protein
MGEKKSPPAVVAKNIIVTIFLHIFQNCDDYAHKPQKMRGLQTLFLKTDILKMSKIQFCNHFIK